MDNLEKYEKFFDCDLKIKKLLYDCIFDEKYSYNQETVMIYSEMLEDKIEEIEYYMDYISNLFYGKVDENLKNLMINCKQKLIDCGSDHIKIKQFIEKYMTGMREELLDEVGRNCYGYGGTGVSIAKAQSLNEALHIIHTSIINNERKYGNIPVLATKKNFEEYDINLYGRENFISKDIFNSFPFELSLGDTDILSLNDKILIMVRDRGHALSIEITVEGDKCFVEYYIPKICNVDMVNQLKGVKKVNNQSKYTIGRFETETNKIGLNIVDFIAKVPMDIDMVFYENDPIYQEYPHKTL